MSNPTLSYTAPATVGRFMLDDHKVRLLLGPYGSGKTTGCIMELAKRMLEEHPDAGGVRRTRFVIVRNTAQQLRQTILEDIRKWLQPVMTYKVTDSTIMFDFMHPTQGRIHSEWMLIPLDKPEDQQRLLSLNITGGWVSEYREIPISVVEALLGRVGRYRPLGVAKNAWYGIIGESNPPDEDSEWYIKMEVDLPNNWAVFKQPGGMEPTAENRENLPDGYYESLIESNTEDWVDVHVHAKYGKSLAGQAVFRTSFKPDVHVSYQPLNVNALKPLMLAQDFGRTPAALFCQLDAIGRLVVLREAVSNGMGIEQFATTILRPLIATYYQGLKVFMVADPAGRQKSQVGEESPFECLKRLGFRAYPAPTNDLEPRLRAAEQIMLRRDGLLIDGENCPLLVQALKSYYRYKRSKQTAELADAPDKNHPWSDLGDCIQYAALGALGNYTAQVIADATPRPRSPRPSVASWT
jgi:hypothetical protein